jgi:hypothetical protein
VPLYFGLFILEGSFHVNDPWVLCLQAFPENSKFIAPVTQKFSEEALWYGWRISQLTELGTLYALWPCELSDLKKYHTLGRVIGGLGLK